MQLSADGAPVELADLTVTAMASDGRGVARRADGKVVFVAGALPEERVLAAVADDRARFGSARTVEVIEASPLRREPPCPRVAEGCGGCQWQHVDLAGQRDLKVRIITETLRRIGRMEPPGLSPTVELPAGGHRTTLRLGIVAGGASRGGRRGGRPGGRRGAADSSAGRAGFRAARSHLLISPEGCLVAHPLLHDLLLRRYPGASEVTLRCGARTGERLVRARPHPAGLDLPPDVSTRHFHEEAAGRIWRISADSFFQSRPDGADALASLVSSAAGDGGGRRAVDLYSGVGLFAGVLAERGWRVEAVEGTASSVADARENLEGLDVEVLAGDVGTWTPAGGPPDLVVADPARAGLGREGAAAVVAAGAGRVVLVSCDVASLARDVALLGSAGYEVASMTPVDMFPHTFHVEVVTVLDRA
jgi:23S rRNA (uracil1939-C5)-methyltransferase